MRPSADWRMIDVAMKTLIRITVAAAPLALLALFAPPVSAQTIRHLHEDDSGRTIHVSVGVAIKVRLPGGSNGGYHPAHTSDRDVVRRISASGGYPTNDDAVAIFRARHSGTATLTAYTDYSCLHTDPHCDIAQRAWLVRVIVR